MERQATGRTLYRCQSLPNNNSNRRKTFGASTRMKKVAPPPPGAPKQQQQPAVSNGDFLRRQEAVAPRQPMSCTPGEDCAFDELLEGRMELEVVLPDTKSVRMTVDRRTPMMDLLVHIATTNKISPSGHTIKVLSEEQHSILYKPNTPIGSLDVNTVYVVPKTSVDIPVKRMPKLANQPFEQTFRLQVNLPRNQRMVLRVSPRITLAELKRQICHEKELDHGSHHLVHPTQPDTLLDLNSTLDVYGCAEINLLSNSGLRESIHNLSTQLIAYPRNYEEEKKKRGILRLFSRRKRETSTERSANDVNNQHVSPVRNSSNTLNRESHQPKQSTKRKPAPAPPPAPLQTSNESSLVIQSSSSINSRPESEVSAKTDELGSTVSHSRHSSDSSGYHEPSVFSDCSENKSPEASLAHCGNVISGQETTSLCKDVPDTTTHLKSVPPPRDLSNLKTVQSSSSTSIISATRKRKAPQPPAPALPEVETPSSPEDLSPVERDAKDITAGFCIEPCEPAPTLEGELERDTRARESIEEAGEDKTNVSQQENDALEYLENVLQESETLDIVDSSDRVEDFTHKKLELDDIETDCCQLQSNDASQTPFSIPIFEPNISATESPDEDDVKSDEAPCILSIMAEAEKAFTDSDYYADLSSTNTDSSDTPPVPLNKDIFLQENEEVLTEAKSDLNDTLKSETTSECINSENDAEEIPFVPIKNDCPSIKQCETSETNKSKETLSRKVSGSSSCDNKKYEQIMSPSSQRKLVNFAMGCYKSNAPEDIYKEQPHEHPTRNTKVAHTNTFRKSRQTTRNEIVTEAVIHEIPRNQNTHAAPCIEIIPFEERKLTRVRDSSVPDNARVRVRQKCTELSSMGTLPLTGRSMSLYNLSPQLKTNPVKKVNLQIKSETSDNLKRTHSEQDVCQEVPIPEEKSDFVLEQKRLQEEYLKLQMQFMSWQKQLLSNQTLLQTERIVPQMSFPAFEPYQVEQEEVPVPEQEIGDEGTTVENMKTRSLPRSKSRPLSVRELNRSVSPPTVSRKSKSEEVIDHSPLKHEKAVMSDSGISTEETSDHSNVPSEIVEETLDLTNTNRCQTLPRSIAKPESALGTAKTMTLNRQVRHKTQVVSVTIGSWQQRNTTSPDISSGNVASSRSMFQSLENIPRDPNVSAAPVASLQKKTSKHYGVSNGNEKPASSRITTAAAEEKRDTEKAKYPSDNIYAISKKAKKPTEKPASHKSDSTVPHQKSEQKIVIDKTATTTTSKTKAFVRLSSMKDEAHPALHVLKKWPLPDINEKETTKPKEQSFWEEITASAKRPTGRSQEKVTRGEVDLRKHHRSAKSDTSSSSRSKESDEPVVKVHVTKVNISGGQKDEVSSDVKSKHKLSKNPGSIPTSNTFPTDKSLAFNDELKNVLSKRASTLATSAGNFSEPTYAEAKDSNESLKDTKVSQNGNSPPPPPPPPVSTMPAIPPAVPIPKSSQLLMDKRVTHPKQFASQPKLTSNAAPREELMLEIRGFGGRQALRKKPVQQSGWNLKIYGSTSAVNS